jgi:hypothetical protein
MDLTIGYHRVHMNGTDTWKKNFKTKFGIYEWMVMSFSLTNACATFMRLINDNFIAHLGKKLVIYLDDMLVLTKI